MAVFIPAALWLLGVGGSSVTEAAGCAVITTAARGAISYLAKEAAKKATKQCAKKVIQKAAKNIVTKTAQNGAVNSVFTEAAQVQQNVGWITTKVLHGAKSVEGAYRTFNQINQSISKMRTFYNFIPRP